MSLIKKHHAQNIHKITPANEKNLATVERILHKTSALDFLQFSEQF